MTLAHPARFDSAVDAYVARLHREVLRLVFVVRNGFDADDIAQEVVEEMLENPEWVMARYPDPHRYAVVRTRHAGIEHDRRQRAQRGEGVRLRSGPDGVPRPLRTVLAGDAAGPDGGDPLFSLLADPAQALDDTIVERLDASAALRRCCQGITREALRELWLVDGCGYSVNEVALMCRQRRETVSRRLNDTRRRIQQNRALMECEREVVA